MERVSLKSKFKHKTLYMYMKCAKKRLKGKFIMIMYKNINIKWKKQGYNTRSYLKLMLNRLKIIIITTFICNVAYVIDPNVIKLLN